MASKEKVNLREYLEILYKMRIHFLTVFFVISAIVTIASYFMQKAYISKTLILIERQNVLKDIVNQGSFNDEVRSRIQTFKEMIVSTSNLIDIIKKLDLDVNFKGLGSLEKLINKMRGNINVTVKGINLFEISYEDENPNISMSVTRALADNFIESSLRESRSETYSAFDFINNQLEQYKNNLEKSEVILRAFKEKHLDELPGEVNANLSKLSNYETALADAKLALNIAMLKRNKLMEQLEKEKPFVDVFGDEETRLNFLQNQLKGLLFNYTDKYPEVVRIKKEIEKIKKHMDSKDNKETSEQVLNPETAMPNPSYQKLKEDLGAIEIEIMALQSRLKEFQQKAEEYLEKAQSVPQQEEELTRITRDYSVNEQIYQMLLKRLQEARITKELQADERNEKFRIVDPARVPTNPVKPNRARIILLGLLLGVAGGIGIIILREYFDHSIRDLNDAKEFFQIPIIGTIPTMLSENGIKREKKINLIGGIVGIIYLLSIFALTIIEFLKYNP